MQKFTDKRSTRVIICDSYWKNILTEKLLLKAHRVKHTSYLECTKSFFVC